MAPPDSLAHLPGHHFLFVPGPTNVSERVLRAMDRPMEDHRSSAFPAFVRPLLEDLKRVFRTAGGQVLLFAATGSGGWEASLVTNRSHEDRLLGVRNGSFSHGSHMGLGRPPGLGIDYASQRGLVVIADARCSRSFFDVGDMARANAGGYFPYTPALSLLFGLRESLYILFEEGLDNVFARHRRLAEGVRAAVAAWGLATCARRPEWCSDSVTAVMVPDGVDGAEVVDIAFRRYNLSLGGGL